MKIGLILQQESEYKRLTEKKAKRNATVALVSATLVFVAQLVASFVFASVLISSNAEPAGYVLMITEIAMYVFYIAVPGLISLILFKFTCKDKYNFVKRSSPNKPFLFIFGALGCSYIVNFIALILFPWLTDFGETTPIVAKTPLEIALCFVMYAVLPAILEEWVFRGIILKNLLPYGKWGAIIISALLFGFGHLHPRSVINAVTFGVVLGICYEYTGSLKIPMLIHFLNNSISTVGTLIPEDSPWIIAVSLLIYVFMGVGIGAIVYYAGKGYKRHRFTLNKPEVIGYKLSIGVYIKKLLLNFAIIPYVIVFSLYFYLAFYFTI